MRKRTQGREIALQILYQYEMNPESVEPLIQSYWENQHEIDPEVREFAEKLVRGTVEHLKEIDPIISAATEHWQLDRMAVIDRNVMRCATYELLFMDDIPPKVTINEAVNLAKKFSQIESGKFVNGVLDKICHTHAAKKSALNE